MNTIRFLIPCLALLLPLQGAEESSKELLRDGLFEEEVNQDSKKAEAAYRAVAQRYVEERQFAGLAIFRLAEIARKSGNQEQAAALYRQVAGEFADQEEIAKRARAQLGDADEANMVLAVPGQAPVGNAEALELQHLQKMERDSPDLLNGVDEDGWFPIHKAAANGWTNAIDYLLERKVAVDPRVKVKSEWRSDGYTPLHLAVIHGHLTVVDRLLAAKADPSFTVSVKPEDLPLPVRDIPLDIWGDWSPLHFSILFQRREIMARLLEAEAPLAAGGPVVATYKTSFIRSAGGGTSSKSWNFGATPLILAVWLNDEIAIRTLIDHGADLNRAASDDGESPLLAAIWKHHELVPTLLDQGARVTDESIFGRTALHWAIMKCPLPIVLRLIKEGADVNIRVKVNRYSSEDYPTPLEAALNTGKEKEALCEALLEAGATSTSRALNSVSSYGFFRLITAFLEAGADPNGSDQDGNRPLHQVYHVTAAQILIEAGARLEVKNHEGVTPLGSIISRDDTPEFRALIDYLLEQGADASVIPSLLTFNDFNLGNRPLLPYVMGKTELVGKSNPEAIMLAFPRNWTVVVGEDRVLPGTPAPSLREFLSLNHQVLSQDRERKPRNGSSRSSAPRVVTDLVIHRPDENGELVEVAQLADQATVHGPTPALQWGDIVLVRVGPKSSAKQQMPLIHHVGGLESRTVTFKVGSREHKVSIENTHMTAPGLELRDHFSSPADLIDLSKVILRRADGKSKTFNLNLTHDPKKIRLMDGDVIEYSLQEQEQVDPAGPFWEAHVLFPDRPSIAGRYSKELVLSDHLHGSALPLGRDFSKLEIQRMGENGLETIPLDLLAASRSLTDDEGTLAKAIELLKTPIRSGDILVIPPREHVSWQDRNKYTRAALDPEIGALVNLVQPAPRGRPPTSIPIPRTNSSSSRTNGRRVVLPPSR